ncbi:putative pentatricopeptide repeat-containing protein [Drosera capensis]
MYYYPSFAEIGIRIWVHGYVVKSGRGSSVFVGSAVVGLYGRSGIVGDAEKMFDEMPARNTGIELVSRIPVLGLERDRFALTAVLSCCAGLAAVDMGRQVHGHLVRRTVRVGSDVFMVSALIEMYGKCGLVGKARDVFWLRGLNVGGDFDRDVVLWTSMLGAYGRNGNYLDAIKLFGEMLAEGSRPDSVVFVTVISTCSLSGQVGLGVEYFESMTRDFGLEPGSEHYSCIVDLLCRAGELEKAWNLVNKIPHGTEVHASLWGALLQACLDNGNIDLGRLVARKDLELDLQSTGICALVLSLYAKFGMQDEIEQVTELMNNKGVKKDLGCSWIEIEDAGLTQHQAVLTSSSFDYQAWM